MSSILQGVFMTTFYQDHFKKWFESFYAFREKYGLSGSVLKWIAIISMLVDHTGATVVRKLASSHLSTDPEVYRMLSRIYYYMRRFGRLAFPIFCFMIVEGFFHTRSVKNYAKRLFLFALISEFPFDFALHHRQPLMTKQNVYFTLLIGLLVIWGVSLARGMIAQQLMIMAFGMMFAKLLRTDYSYHGVFLIEMLYVFRSLPVLQSVAGGSYMYQYEGTPTQFAFLPILFYNGKRGRQNKYLFYLFYPVHLLVLGIIAYVVLPHFL